MADLNKILLNNTFTFPGGFNIDSTEPIDSRFQVDTKEDLYKDWGNAKVTNKDGVNEVIYKYDGLITYVKSEGKSYRYNSSLLSDENLKGWELVPVLSDIPVQGISVDGVEIEPDENGIVNITLPEIPEVVHPEYELDYHNNGEYVEKGKIDFIKDGEVLNTVDIYYKAENYNTAKSLATKENEGKIIYVKNSITEGEGETAITYNKGLYYVCLEGEAYIIKYLAETSGSNDLDADKLLSLINANSSAISVNVKNIEANTQAIEVNTQAIDAMDWQISAGENQYVKSFTIENGKLVGEVSYGDLPEQLVKEGDNGNYTVGGDTIITQDTFNTTLLDYKVKNVKEGDQILSVDSNGDLSSTLSIEYLNGLITLRGKENEAIGESIDCSDFIKDGFLESATYDEATHKLTLTWNTDVDGEKVSTPTVIDLSDLVDAHKVIEGNSIENFVKLSVSESNAEGVLTFTITIDDSDLKTKIDDIEDRLDNIENNVVKEGTSIDNFVKLEVVTDENTNDVTITIDDSDLKTKLENIEGNFANYVESVDSNTKEEQSTLLAVEVDNTDKQNPVISLVDNGLNDKFDEINGKFVESVDASALDEQDTLVKVKVDNTDSQKPVISLDDSVLDTKLGEIDSKFDDYLPYNKIDDTEKGELIGISLNIDTDSKELSVSVNETKLNEKFANIDKQFDDLVDADTKCTLATINADTEVEVPTVDEVDVLKNVAIELNSETGESLSGTATAVKVVTKQYVDSKFTEVPTYTAITNAEIDSLFV